MKVCALLEKIILLTQNLQLEKCLMARVLKGYFPLFSPNIDSIQVIRKGDVKKSKTILSA